MIFKFQTCFRIVCFSFVFLLAQVAAADLEVTAGEIIQPLDGVNVTAGYGTLKNLGKKPIQVEFVAAEKFKAGEFHETITTKGKAEMRHLVVLKMKAGESILFQRGGSHLMLYDPMEIMAVGTNVKVTLKVDGKITEVPFKIVARPK